MGNKPAPAKEAEQPKQLQQTMAKDIERVKSTYTNQTSGEKVAVSSFTRELKRDDPKKFYKFGQVLGTGAFGQVDQVFRIKDKKPFACKKINTTAAGCKDDMLHREIGTMLKCHHEHLIGIHVFSHGRYLYIVMDLVPEPAPSVAPDLFSWLMEPDCGLGEENNATPNQVATIIYKSASAIKYMNDEMGAIHRDLKPENILVGPDGIEQLKVTDFGLSRLGVDTGSSGFSGTFQAGTEGYMAPELLDRNMAVDGKIFYGTSR